VLFRVLALTHQPVPTTFATGLAGYLLGWSLGVALARYARWTGVVAGITAALVAGVPLLYEREVYDHALPLVAAIAAYVAPVVGFGLLYGQLVARSTTSWGRDVGRYTAANTLGSCLGILGFTWIGHELPIDVPLHALGLGLVAVGAVELGVGRWRVLGGAGAVAALAAALAVAVAGWVPYTERAGWRTYWGRDGVIDVAPDRDVYIDGLWHTKLSDGRDHVGSPYSWLMAFAAVVAHGDPHRALVIGGGVGISSAALAGVDGMTVDVYEIDHTLQRVLRDYPDETLHAATTPTVRWIWQDARTGMALDPTTYDVILSAPLYLRQAGSSLLLSKEYLRLAKSRLNPGGVLAVYSNEGSPAQTRLVQRTIAALFQYRVTWYDGLVTVASDRPLALDRGALAVALARPDPLFREARDLDASLVPAGLFGWYDGDGYTTALADREITDDQPLVEYPELAELWVGLLR
ncbi:MAG: hypothetical protein ABMB14_02580, partial [Myxococcota bacterium]